MCLCRTFRVQKLHILLCSMFPQTIFRLCCHLCKPPWVGEGESALQFWVKLDFGPCP